MWTEREVPIFGEHKKRARSEETCSENAEKQR